MSTSDVDAPIRRRPNRGWIWFFAVMILLSVAAAAITWTYNVHQQLTPEQLAAAQKLWSQKGPADYDLEIEKKFSSAASDGPENRDTIAVKVRRGKVLAGTLNGRAITEARLLAENDMPSWFGFIEEFLQNDLKPNAARTFRTAYFDPQTGALLNFRRRVSGTHERQEITIRVSPPSPLKPTNPS